MGTRGCRGLATLPGPLATWVHDPLHRRWRLQRRLHGPGRFPTVRHSIAEMSGLGKRALYGGAGCLQQGLGEPGKKAKGEGRWDGVVQLHPQPPRAPVALLCLKVPLCG